MVYTIFKFSKLETVENFIYIAPIEKRSPFIKYINKTKFFKSMQMIRRQFLMQKLNIFLYTHYLLFFEKYLKNKSKIEGHMKVFLKT